MYDPDRRQQYPGDVAPEAPAAVVDNGRGAWSVWLSPDVTVPELANLMRGLRDLGRRVIAEHMGAGVFVLVPLDAGQAPPTARDLAGIWIHIPGNLPSLTARR